MIRWNLFFEVEKVEQLALIDRLATHHDRPPSLKASGNRNHDSSIFTRPFSTGSTQSGHWTAVNPAVQQSRAYRGVLPFGRSTGATVSETSRIHYAVWRRGGRVAACRSRTTAASGYRYPEQPFAGDRCTPDRCHSTGIE